VGDHLDLQRIGDDHPRHAATARALPPSHCRSLR
jgi:hypothetical protein